MGLYSVPHSVGVHEVTPAKQKYTSTCNSLLEGSCVYTLRSVFIGGSCTNTTALSLVAPRNKH